MTETEDRMAIQRTHDTYNNVIRHADIASILGCNGFRLKLVV